MERPGRSPVVETGAHGEAVGQSVGDGEPSRTLQLGQHNDHLSGRKNKEIFQISSHFKSSHIFVQALSLSYRSAIGYCDRSHLFISLEVT